MAYTQNMISAVENDHHFARRKQKWSVDPRNSAWSKDESKLGQKMLERMGWSKGKGLGKSEQGATEHIKVKVKNNGLGLGTAVSNEDNWIAHQDDFNQLLADLNSCHGQNSSDEPKPEQKQSFSLEEKSKTSRKRVHYMKFTKGKDLSSRSETDLACIFGTRSKQSNDQDADGRGHDSQEEKEVAEEVTPDPEEEPNTVTSTLTMQQYFAQRMARLKKDRAEGRSPASTSGGSSNAPSPSATHESTEDSQNPTGVEHQSKKKKKERQNTKEVNECVAVPHATEESADQEQTCSDKKKKKKKKNREAREEVVAEECSAPTGVEENCEDTETPKAERRKKRKHKETPSETDLVHGRDAAEKETEDSVVADKKKKKRKRREQEEEVEEVVVVEEKKKSKKDKKKKKRD